MSIAACTFDKDEAKARLKEEGDVFGVWKVSEACVGLRRNTVDYEWMLLTDVEFGNGKGGWGWTVYEEIRGLRKLRYDNKWWNAVNSCR